MCPEGLTGVVAGPVVVGMNSAITNLPHELNPVGPLYTLVPDATVRTLTEIPGAVDPEAVFAWDAKAGYVVIQVEGGDVRYTTDGQTDPVEGEVGFLWSAKQYIVLKQGVATKLRLIAEGATRIQVQGLGRS